MNISNNSRTSSVYAACMMTSSSPLSTGSSSKCDAAAGAAGLTSRRDKLANFDARSSTQFIACSSSSVRSRSGMVDRSISSSSSSFEAAADAAVPSSSLSPPAAAVQKGNM